MGKPSMGIAPIAYNDNREIMVRQQLVRRGVDNKGVLRAMLMVPRHLDRLRANHLTALRRYFHVGGIKPSAWGSRLRDWHWLRLTNRDPC